MGAVQLSESHALPDEVWTKIFEYLTPAQILTASIACKFFYAIASDNVLWKKCCASECRNVLRFSPSSWKGFYREINFASAKKAFKQEMNAKPTPQPIVQDAYNFKLNGKEGVAILTRSGKCLYRNFGKKKTTEDQMSLNNRTQAILMIIG